MARPSAPRGQGRARVMVTALELFARQGVSGTSLQNIADQLGVTKAAVYYQFRSKEEIVLAVVEDTFADLRTFLDEAEAEPDEAAATDRALVGLVELMIDHRQAIAALLLDPEVGRIVDSHPELAALTERMSALLVGSDASLSRRVAASVVGSGLAHAGMDPDLAEVPDDVLRRELLAVGRAVLLPRRGQGG
jgi:AcrR family transcriptional regulator